MYRSWHWASIIYLLHDSNHKLFWLHGWLLICTSVSSYLLKNLIVHYVALLSKHHLLYKITGIFNDWLKECSFGGLFFLYKFLSMSFFPTSGTYLILYKALYISLEIHRSLKKLSFEGFLFYQETRTFILLYSILYVLGEHKQLVSYRASDEIVRMMVGNIQSYNLAIFVIWKTIM